MRLQARREVRQSMKVPSRVAPRRDVGYFGPDSVTWRVTMHPVQLVAAMRNVLYTELSSGVSQGVNDHSDHYVDPVNRAQQTMYAMLALYLGDSVEATRAGQYVRGRHAKVEGYDPATGGTYSANDPVYGAKAHGLIAESNVAAYETFVAPLTEADRERYWREQFVLADLIGLDVAMLPESWSAWRSFYDEEILPGLNYSYAANKLVEWTRAASYMPAPLRPLQRSGYDVLNELALATVGHDERAILGHRRSAAHLAAVRATGTLLFGAADRQPLRSLVDSQRNDRARVLLDEARSICAGETVFPERQVPYEFRLQAVAG